jgi:hypothetical protein
MKKVPKQVRALLDDSGRSWRVENASKHFMLYVDDQRVTILPHGHGGDMKHDTRNTLGHVKRFLERRP